MGSRKYLSYFAGLLAILIASSTLINIQTSTFGEAVLFGKIRGVVSGNPDFGSGADGPLTIYVDTIDDPIDSVASGTAGQTLLFATNLAFAGGQKIMIHQAQGVGAGTWEINEINSYIPGEITLINPLRNSYTGKAQVLVLRQYTDVYVYPGVTYKAKAWNGATGGILTFLANGTTTIDGSISASNKGFRGAVDHIAGNGADYTGEGTGGVSVRSHAAQGNGGGGGENESGGIARAGAGGGGNGTKGLTGASVQGAATGVGGGISGTYDLIAMTFGGGGGGVWKFDATVGNGGDGGGIIFLSSPIVSVGSAGAITSNGGYGTSTSYGGISAGGGAGGSILIRAQTAMLGTSQSTALGGLGGGGLARGGNGGYGRIRIEYCDSMSGTTNPSASAHKLNCVPPNESPIAVVGTSLDDDGNLELNGSLSSDSDQEDVLSYTWKITIDGSTDTRNGEVVSVVDLETGEYVVVLSVSDGDLVDEDTMLLGVPVAQEVVAPVVATQNIVDKIQESINANPNTSLADKLDDALAKTQTALAQISLPAGDRQAAIGSGGIEGAIGDIQSLVDDGLLDQAVGRELMDDLAAIARQVAQDAIDLAVEAGGDPDVILEAQGFLAEGDNLRNQNLYKNATNKYKDALGKAESVL